MGGACLGFLKRRYHNTHHHLLVLVMVGAVAYLATFQIQRAANQATDRLAQNWLAVARAFSHSLERSADSPETLDRISMKSSLLRAQRNLGLDTYTCRTASLVTKGTKGDSLAVSISFQNGTDMAPNMGQFNQELAMAFQGTEVWSHRKNLRGDATSLLALVPVRDRRDQVAAVLAIEYFTPPWNEVRSREQWRVVGEFGGLLVICLCLGGFLVVTSEARRKKELEKAIMPLMKDIESLDGMVNTVEGVVWERPAGGRNFTYLSHNADGYLGYDIQRWGSDSGFLENVIHSEDRERVAAIWKEAIKNLGKYHVEYRVVRPDGATAFVSECGQAARLMLDGKVLRGILLDVTSRRETEASTHDQHRMMVEASRQAGMAEIATGVLHNVGNVLNSLNVGAKLLSERLRKSRLDKLCQAAQLLKDNLPGNPEFFIQDKRGQALPGYLVELSGYLREEQNRLDATVSDMIDRIEHIRDMIMLQQSHSAVRTLWEPLDMATVMEEALRLEMDVHMAHQQVTVIRHFADLPPIYSARGLLLQILVNLLANACQAMADVPAPQRKLTLRIQPQNVDKVRISVEDTGCGIHPRHLTSIFTQGFTTKKDGHGFGLHHACLLAQDLGGVLRAESDGIGRGARFILEIPARKDAGNGHATSAPESSGFSGPSTSVSP